MTYGKWKDMFERLQLGNGKALCLGFVGTPRGWGVGGRSKRRKVKRKERSPQPMWLSWLDVIPETKRPPVQFPVRAHAWVVGSVPDWGVYGR